jgi:hypothetical protein
MPDFEPVQTKGGWLLEVDGLTVQAEEIHSTRSGIKARVTVRDADSILFCDSLNLTSSKTRADFIRKLKEKGTALDERALIALEEAIRTPDDLDEPTTTEILEGLPRLSRPLSLVEGVSYAAVVLRLRTTRRESSTNTQRLCVVRWDGSQAKFFGPTDSPLDELGIEVDLPFQPPEDKSWSPQGVRAFLDGHRANPREAFRQISAVIDRFIDFDRSFGTQEEMCALLAVYIMATYFLDTFTVVGYLWPTGDMGSGKTHVLTIVAQLSYLGRLVLAGGSYPTLRDEAHYGATLCFDDAEQVASKNFDLDKRALFLAGNRNGVTVSVKEPMKDGTWRTRHYNAFCPRAFSAIRLPDPVLASRSIALPLARTTDEYRANADPMEETLWPHDRRQLADDLWNIGLVHRRRVAELFRSCSSGVLLGRQFEPWRCLFAVATLIQEDGETGLLSTLQQLADRYQQERPELEFGDGRTTVVVRALCDILGLRPECETTAAEVVGRCNKIAETEGLTEDQKPFLSARQAGNLLNQLRVPRGRRQGKMRPRCLTRALVDKLRKAYGLTQTDDDVTTDDNDDKQFEGAEETVSRQGGGGILRTPLPIRSSQLSQVVTTSYPLPVDRDANGECKGSDPRMVNSEALKERTLSLWREAGEPDITVKRYEPKFLNPKRHVQEAETTFLDPEGHIQEADDPELRRILAVMEEAIATRGPAGGEIE